MSNDVSSFARVFNNNYVEPLTKSSYILRKLKKVWKRKIIFSHTLFDNYWLMYLCFIYFTDPKGDPLNVINIYEYFDLQIYS